MEAKEFRIGNYIGVAEFMNYKIGKVTSISDERILIDWKISSKNHKFIPITLTEEILLKCGFIKSIDNGYNLKLTRNSYIYIDYAYSYSELSVSNHSLMLDIKYLHQLQNLYWCLTGEELQVNL